MPNAPRTRQTTPGRTRRSRLSTAGKVRPPKPSSRVGRGFFQPRALFEALERSFFPRLLDQREARTPIRVWVTGCGTGEPAYSVAVCLLEALRGRAAGRHFQIFASDDDAEALASARRGLYPQSIEREVSLDRLRRFFLPQAGKYRIAPPARDKIVFAEHDLLKSWPFWAMDLVLCGNPLSSFSPHLHDRILRTFHMALRPHGVLAIGTAHKVEADDLFAALDSKVGLYWRRASYMPVSMGPPRRPLHDLRRRNDWELRLRARLEQLAVAQTRITEAVAELPDGGIQPVFDEIAKRARLLMEAEYAALGIGGLRGKRFVRWAEDGTPGNFAAMLANHPDNAHGYPRNVRQLLIAPVVHRHRQIASLYVARRRLRGGFDRHDERFLLMLAERAASAIETAHMAAREQAQRTWLQAAIDQMPEGTILLDAGGRAIVNARAREYAKLDSGRTDPFGNPILLDLRDASGAPLRFEDWPIVRAFQRKEKLTNQEMALEGPDGRLMPILASATPILNPDGSSAGALAVLRDLTATRELVRLRNEWAALVAHDLREPLSTIKQSDETLARSRSPRMGLDEAAALERIGLAVERMTHLIDELLAVSLLEAHQVMLSIEDVALGPLVDDAVAQAEAMAPGRSIRVEKEADLPAVDADRERMRRVLVNLLSNAIKYGTPGTPIVAKLGRRNDAVEVTIGSQGGALTEEDAQRVFEPMYRTAAARASGQSGTGLGLYIARRLIEAHGGRIWAASADGVTTFGFALPLSPAV